MSKEWTAATGTSQLGHHISLKSSVLLNTQSVWCNTHPQLAARWWCQLRTHWSLAHRSHPPHSCCHGDVQAPPSPGSHWFSATVTNLIRKACISLQQQQWIFFSFKKTTKKHCATLCSNVLNICQHNAFLCSSVFDTSQQSASSF